MQNSFVTILFSKSCQRFDSNTLNSYLDCLPLCIQRKISKYIRWEDFQSSLIGYLLLKECLRLYNFERFMHLIKFNEFGRPHLNKNIDFNISHSGSYVLCAISDNTRLGIDIEIRKNVELVEYYDVMRFDEKAKIINSSDSLSEFYDYWTIKESIIKADGRGLSIPLKDVYIKKDEALLYNSMWYYQKIVIDDKYTSHLTTDKNNIKINKKELIF